MKLRLLALFFILVFLPISLSAQEEREKAFDYLNKRGEVYFSFLKPDISVISLLSKKISIDNVTADSVFAYANFVEFEDFLKTGIGFRVLKPAGEAIHPKSVSTGNWDFYPTHSQYVSLMNEFENNYPHLCKHFSIGKSVQNRDLLFVRITSGVTPSKNKPKFMYSSTMHGDETVGFVLMLRLIEYLLSNYGTNERVTRLLDEIEIYINPLLNPDGAYYGGNGDSIKFPKRFNANDKDLNRNFPDPRSGANPGGVYQPETLAMMAFLDTLTVTMSANFHGGAEVVNFPWDTWTKRHADHAWFRNISKEYADTAQFYSPAGYLTSINPQGFVKGSDWYIITGGQQDYVTYFRGGREVTVELSNTKFPPASALNSYWDYNYRSLLNYMEQVLYGLKGTVSDKNTGLPLKVKIELIDHDADSSWTFSSALSGRYFRPAAQDVYSVRASLFGYKTKVINIVQVFSRQSTLLDIQMEPIEDLPLNDTVYIVPNPIRFSGDIRIFIYEKATITVDIFDIMGRKISGILPREYTRGEIILTLNSSNLKPGLNYIKVKINNSYYTKKVIFIPD